MELEPVFVALGSNLGDRENHIRRGLVELAELADSTHFMASSIYETDPMGPQNQPDYLNAVCRFDYAGTPFSLLTELQAIERAHGRARVSERWTARALDLDILLFGNRVVAEAELQIPHVGIAHRSFVLWPLAEIAPELHIPGVGKVSDLSGSCPRFGIKLYDSATT